MDHEIKTIIQSSSKNILDLQEIVPTIIESIECIVECLKKGKKVVIRTKICNFFNILI